MAEHDKYNNTHTDSRYMNNEEPGNESYDTGEIINAESLNVDSTLDEVSRTLQQGQTLILDIGNNYHNQTDIIYDTLVTKGYNVKKSFRNGRNQILVSKK